MISRAVSRCVVHLGVLFLVSLASCGGRTQYVALGERFQSRSLPEGQARIVVMWPTDAQFGSMIQPRVLIKGIDIGKLEPLGYLDAIINSGEATVALRWQGMSDGKLVQAAGNLVVVGQPGAEVFVEYMPKSGFFHPELVLTELPVGTGGQKASLVRKCVQN
jgi:hypothetical protein